MNVTWRNVKWVRCTKFEIIKPNGYSNINNYNVRNVEVMIVVTSTKHKLIADNMQLRIFHINKLNTLVYILSDIVY